MSVILTINWVFLFNYKTFTEYNTGIIDQFVCVILKNATYRVTFVGGVGGSVGVPLGLCRA